ncbi:M48 family metallopeptidase [Veronia pacifica]|nr:M48 family metallopeptidase [Veronia pacifica]
MTINTEDDFIALVRKSEIDAKNNPRAYNRKLFVYALFGYGIILLMLVLLLGLVGGLIGTAFFSAGIFILLLKTKIIIPLVLAAWVLMKALWVKMSPPEGMKLNRRDHPELFKEIDQLRRELNSLKIHEVILDDQLNAGVVQHPRLGILGWHKNTLILGYQLLLTMDPEQMRSILAHEFGHLSGNHSRFSGWIYRVRTSWLKVMQACDESDSWGGRMTRAFFNWYAPNFEAYSFALARNNEYEADAIAAKLTSPAIAGSALVNVYATAPFIEQKYWASFYQKADEYETPPFSPFLGLEKFLVDNALGEEELRDRIDLAMKEETHYSNTHPSLKDRMSALAIDATTPEPCINHSAKVWLGDRHHEIVALLDKEWLENNQESWKQRYNYVSDGRQSLAAFSKKMPEVLSDKELWKYAYLTYEFETHSAALPLFMLYQNRNPKDPESAMFVGSILIEQSDDSGLSFLKQAQESSELIRDAANLGYDFLIEQGRDEEAETWWQEATQKYEYFEKIFEEAREFRPLDEYKAPELPDEALRKLTDALSGENKVKEAWVSQKELSDDVGVSAFIVVFSVKFFTLSPEKIEKRLQDALNLEGYWAFICDTDSDRIQLVDKVVANSKKLL